MGCVEREEWSREKKRIVAREVGDYSRKIVFSCEKNEQAGWKLFLVFVCAFSSSFTLV